MKLINKIIKILVNFKYKKEPFMAWTWGIDDIHEIYILSAEYYMDHYRYGTREEYYSDRASITCSNWIDNHNGTISCSRCHTWFSKDIRYPYMRHCPYCGLSMVESEG